MKLTEGRPLSEDDVKGTPPVAVINESFAKHYFSNKNPLGQHIMVPEIEYAKTRFGREIPWEVVGVVADEKIRGLGDKGANIFKNGMYVPEDQSPQTTQFFVVRGAMDPIVLQRSIRGAIHEIDRDQVVDQMKTLDEIKAESVTSDRLQSLLLALFAGMALLLSGMGLYGVISYSVTQRTREIGIRTALGATSSSILRLVLRSGMMLTCIGLIIGVAGALGLSQVLASMLFNVGKHDPATLLAAGGILFFTALLACYFPVRRTMKVSPTVALRYE